MEMNPAYHSTQTFVQLPSEILRDCYLIWTLMELLQMLSIKKYTQLIVCVIHTTKLLDCKPNQNFLNQEVYLQRSFIHSTNIWELTMCQAELYLLST